MAHRRLELLPAQSILQDLEVIMAHGVIPMIPSGLLSTGKFTSFTPTMTSQRDTDTAREKVQSIEFQREVHLDPAVRSAKGTRGGN